MMQIVVIVVFLLAIAGLAYLSLGMGAAMFGYSLLKAKGGAAPSWQQPTAGSQPPPLTAGWAFQYSYNMVPGQTPESFDFPTQDGVHYCVQQAPALSLGQTVTISFNIGGNGALTPTEGDQPARLRLYMQRKGDTLSGAGQYQQYRYWSAPIDLKVGDSTLSAVLDPAQWSDVFGKMGTDFPSQFAACVANAGVIGFTFGGMFAGHGVYVKNGSAHFTLTGYTIG